MPLMKTPTMNIIAKVITWRRSATLNVKWGTTKKKSKAATDNADASTEAPLPKRTATTMITAR